MNGLRKSLPLPLKAVKINDEFWSKHIKLIRDVVMPYQWDALNDNIPDAEPSHAILNFQIAAGIKQGDFHGMVFQDSDVAKWLEAAGNILAVHYDPELEKIADETIDLLEKTQQEDGYLNTYFTVKAPGKRWTNLHESHELYCAGHLIEAAVSYFKATGKRKLLDLVCKYADYIQSVFGTEPGKLRGYDGHQEIELALYKLYEVTGDEKYLKLGKYFLDERGTEPYFFDIDAQKKGHTVYCPDHDSDSRYYYQTHMPVRRQNTAEGHAVRAVYMYTAMADIAAETGDRELLDACRLIWDNIANRRMYVTGGIGSASYGETFTCDYDLPNDTVYAETCASVGLVFFSYRMLQIELKSCYADLMEKALYNTVLAGMSADGRGFFYVNPLEVRPEACKKNPSLRHVKYTRQKWFGCACCPPNVARLLTSLGQYIYTVGDNTIYTHLFIGGETELELEGKRIKLVQQTRYPWEEEVTIKVFTASENEFSMALRIPGWCPEAGVDVNGEAVCIKETIKDGYVYIKRVWKNGDTVRLVLTMQVLRVRANPAVHADIGKVALQRGPVVYCMEEADNGPNLHEICLNKDSNFEIGFDGALHGGVSTILAEAERAGAEEWKDGLYKFDINYKTHPVQARFIPYYSWANRTPGEMQVWVRER